jgi:hypothetical protein
MMAEDDSAAIPYPFAFKKATWSIKKLFSH